MIYLVSYKYLTKNNRVSRNTIGVEANSVDEAAALAEPTIMENHKYWSILSIKKFDTNA